MFAVLANPTFARLFIAQAAALLGTGLLTVALGLLAYDLAGARAGAVLGTALTIKMAAYVGLAPLAGALAERLPRKQVLIAADLTRAAVALALPFVSEVWQVYGLIFVLQAASATFTPAFQALIPDVLPNERDYTNALSLSRLAYDLENLLSPALAGLLLSVMSFHGLFAGTALGFLVSAALVLLAALPPRSRHDRERRFSERLTRGLHIYLATPRLRGLLALNGTAAAAGAFVIVNTVVMVRSGYGGSETDLTLALAAFGAGSMATALALPQVLMRLSDRAAMTGAAQALAVLMLAHAGWIAAFGLLPWPGFLTLWTLSGGLYSGILTPSGRLLRRSAREADLACVFAAQFALSHACWLVAYPVAGWAGAGFGIVSTLALLGGTALAAALAAPRLWPADTGAEIAHDHPDLPADHPHLAEGGRHHAHVFVIDDEHRAWPTQG
ncbi:MAG: MFS transporter [Rhodobacterales bacterium]|nr:MAG: MFS transporter [Rhodobacterales bacterium]